MFLTHFFGCVTLCAHFSLHFQARGWCSALFMTMHADPEKTAIPSRLAGDLLSGFYIRCKMSFCKHTLNHFDISIERLILQQFWILCIWSKKEEGLSRRQGDRVNITRTKKPSNLPVSSCNHITIPSSPPKGGVSIWGTSIITALWEKTLIKESANDFNSGKTFVTPPPKF